MGLGAYTRATDAEPTVGQLKKIQESHNAVRILNWFRPGTELSLESKYSRQLVDLGLSEEFSGVPFREFENDAFPAKDLPNPPSRKTKKSSPFEELANQFSAAFTKAYPRVPVSDPKKLKLFNDLVYEFITEHTLLNLRRVKLAKSNGVSLSEVCRYLKKACMEAIDRDDVNFFARVGDVLRKRQLKPRYWEEDSEELDELDIFLCVHWVKEFDGVKPLYNLSIKELSEICHEKLPGIRTLDAIEKRRQRLGLLRLKKSASSST